MAKATGAAKAVQEKDRGKMREPEAGRPIMPALYGMGKAKKGMSDEPEGLDFTFHLL